MDNASIYAPEVGSPSSANGSTVRHHYNRVVVLPEVAPGQGLEIDHLGLESLDVSEQRGLQHQSDSVSVMDNKGTKGRKSSQWRSSKLAWVAIALFASILIALVIIGAVLGAKLSSNKASLSSPSSVSGSNSNLSVSSFPSSTSSFPESGTASKGGEASAATLTQGTETTARATTTATPFARPNGPVLDSTNIQAGSAQDGSSGLAIGGSLAATDADNFINYCTGKILTNGLQTKAGACNGIPMGDIPSQNHTVSTIITFPGQGQILDANSDILLRASVMNLALGAASNPESTFYANPQALAGGIIIGQIAFTVQSMRDLTQINPLDPNAFAFFIGISDAGDGQGKVSATIPGGLPAGVYRVCTMASTLTYQPVLSAVRQRGAQDDCVRFTTK